MKFSLVKFSLVFGGITIIVWLGLVKKQVGKGADMVFGNKDVVGGVYAALCHLFEVEINGDGLG